MAEDYSSWLTKQQAADRLQVSTKTIEQWAKDGQLQQTVWRPQNRGPLRAVYCPDDVDRIATARQRGPLPPFLVPSAPKPSNGNGHQPESRALTLPSGEDVLRLVFAAAQRSLLAQTSETSHTSEKLFLTLTEAVAYTGVSEQLLRRQMREGTLPYLREPRSQWTKEDRGWRIRRKDLEAARWPAPSNF